MMKVRLVRMEVQSRKDQELIDITLEVERVVKDSGILQGVANIMTTHTSSGIIVTEGLPCLELDVLDHLQRLAPDDGEYYHNRYLEIDGRLGFNASAHLRSIIGGISAFFPVENGKLVKGSRQRVYFGEYDGPLSREYLVQVIGE